MNETEQVNALLGAKKAPGGTSDKDWKAEYEALKAEYERAKPMLGRVNVEAVAAKDKRISELESEIRRLKGAKGAAEIAASLTPEERGEIPEEYVGVAAKIASRATGDAMAGVNQELARLREEREAEKERERKRVASDFVNRINRRYPGFLASIGEGGDKAEAWASFLVNNAASVNEAYGRCDYDSLAYHIDRFYREVLEVRPPNGDKGNASAPDPVSHGGGKPATRDDGKKTYTAEEYSALEEKCMKLRRKGDYDGYAKLREELDEILVDGRVEEG